jgi:hypothetical protein
MYAKFLCLPPLIAVQPNIHSGQNFPSQVRSIIDLCSLRNSDASDLPVL